MKRVGIVFFVLFMITGCSVRKDEYTKDGRLVLKYWEKWTGFEGDAMKRVVDKFNKSQDRLFVEYIAVGQVDRKMLVATAGGDPPDIVGIWSYIVNIYSDKKAIMCLDDFIEEYGIFEDDYIPFFYNLCKHRGKVWALPTTPATLALHWNKRLFREAGLDPNRPPKTIEELDEFAEKLTLYELDDGRVVSYVDFIQLPNYRELIKKAEIVQVGFLPFEPGWWNWSWVYWFGGRLWNGKDKTTANLPENIEAMKWVQSYPKKYGETLVTRFTQAAGSQFASPQNPFLSSKVAMEMQGVWMYNFIRKYAPGMDWGAAPFPSISSMASEPPVAIGEADVLVIPAGAPHPRESFEFIKFVNTQENMELLCVGHRKFSPLKKVSKDFFIKNPHPYIRVFRELAKSKNCFRVPITAVWNEYNREFNVAFDQIRYLEVTPEKAMNDLQKRAQKSLDRELQRLRRRNIIQ